MRILFSRLTQQEDLNFLLTNRIPRRLATRFMGWFSAIEQPMVRDLSIAVWKAFAELDLNDAKSTQFQSLHHCFVRELKDGARPVDLDPHVVVSPCDAIIGAAGTVSGGQLVQAKGFRYSLEDLFCDAETARYYVDGVYVTLRLTSGMYHRFHAPHACRVRRVTHIPGDRWNVNPAALKRVEKLFCRNERALIPIDLDATVHRLMLVPVAAILVAGIRLRFVDLSQEAHWRGTRVALTDASFDKGQEMGWFEHGSTILVFAPKEFALCDQVCEGARIRMGEPLLRLPVSAASRPLGGRQ
jgi:phosphatidylserine decarboxylase